MLPSYILSLREGLEAALIIGIVLGALRQMQRKDLSLIVWAGAFSALIVSIALAILLTRLGMELKDPAEAIFEGLTMLLAAGILTWMIFWMARQSRTIKSNLESGVKQASRAGGSGLFFLAFISVVREGVELALFLTAAVFASDTHQTLLGALLGLGSAVILGAILFATSLKLDLRRFFQVSGFLLILFAAGLAARGMGELVVAGWIPPLIEHVWDWGSVVSGTSQLGMILEALFGYTPDPSLVQVLTYCSYFGIIFMGIFLNGRRSAKKSSPVNA